ncbi:putative aminopeptidase [Burkholderiales bacterium]|nr:putative aminopeptidase [Burkholderiales bacterium]
MIAPTRGLRCAGAGALLVLALAAGGCSIVPYYSQAITGELALLSAARPVSDWLADPATPTDLKQRLELARRIRTFASQELALPDNRSYTEYADLHRSSAVWNVFATPELSLELKTWCYPLFGCAAYRGYFHQQDAEAMAATLTASGLDVYVAPVPAYSTLGWLPDPLLNTFIRWPEPELARLIFHELAHQVVYVRDDTRFNESFATAVEREGVARWVAARNDPALREQFEQQRARQADLLELLQRTRQELQAVYAGAAPPAQRRDQKVVILEQLQARYRMLREQRLGGFDGLDEFFRLPWNNARLAAMAAYQDDVPAFEALLAREHGDLRRFFLEVKKLAALTPEERDARLRALAPIPGDTRIRATMRVPQPFAAHTP